MADNDFLNELQMAQRYITDKNNNMTKTAEKIGVSLGTLAGYRKHPEKLKTAAWITVHQLAVLYDPLSFPNEMTEEQYKEAMDEPRKEEARESAKLDPLDPLFPKDDTLPF